MTHGFGLVLIKDNERRLQRFWGSKTSYHHRSEAEGVSQRTSLHLTILSGRLFGGSGLSPRFEVDGHPFA